VRRPPSILLPRPWRPGEVLALPPGEAAHARARRLRPGAEVAVTDGAGARARALVVECGPRAVSVRVLESGQARPDPIRYGLCVPPLRLPRLSWLVEKATELGAHRVLVVRSTLAQGGRAAAAAAAAQRLRRVAEAAAKQCGRSTVPEISAAVDFENALALSASHRIALDPGGDSFPQELAAGEAVLWVGPEGGFRAEEAERIRSSGWKLASLGPRLLRAETAAVAAAVLACAAFDRALRGADNTKPPSTEGRADGF